VREAVVLRGGHTARVTALAFAPNGSALASWSQDGTLKQWPIHPVKAGGDAFLISVQPPALAGLAGQYAPPPPTLADVQKLGGVLRLQILGDGAQQREEVVQVGPGPLNVLASREGDLLRLQVNNLPPVVFHEPLPGPSGAQGRGVRVLLAAGGWA
jgi:hypothetical protein